MPATPLYMPAADTSTSGYVSSLAQSFGGEKTFNSLLYAAGELHTFTLMEFAASNVDTHIAYTEPGVVHTTFSLLGNDVRADGVQGGDVAVMAGAAGPAARLLSGGEGGYITVAAGRGGAATDADNGDPGPGGRLYIIGGRAGDDTLKPASVSGGAVYLQGGESTDSTGRVHAAVVVNDSPFQLTQLSGVGAQFGILYPDGSGQLTSTGYGAAGWVLTGAGAGVAPVWVSPISQTLRVSNNAFGGF